MRVLMTAGFYDLSGATIVIENLSAKLGEKGVHVTIGALSFAHLPNKKSYDVTVITRGNILRLNRFLDSFDILHNHHPVLNYLGLISHVPLVYHYHGAPNFGTGNLFRFSVLSSVKMTNHRFSAAIAVSETGYDELKKLLNPNKIHVVYNGVDTTLFKPTVKGIFRKGSPQCLFVGNLYDHKKVDELILALRELVKKYPSAHLQIVGGGDARDKLENLVSNLDLEGNVSFAGVVPHSDLPPFYASCDVYVTASRCESFPLPLLEAWACGKPVVASSIASHEELISDSKAGKTYKAGDIPNLCKTIAATYENSDRFRYDALEFAKEHDWSVIADQVLGIYNGVLYD